MTRREMLIQEGARKAYTGTSTEAVCARAGYARGYDKGYEQAEKDILSLIEQRLSELLGDAQPTPILRYELRDLIKKIKEE